MAAMNRLADDTFTDNEIGSQLIDDNLLLELKSCTRSVFKQANDVVDRDTARDIARPEGRDEGLVKEGSTPAPSRPRQQQRATAT